MEKFWMCVIGGTNYFGKQHKTLEEASAEAENLTRREYFKGHRVYVLEAVGYCELADTPIKWGKY